MAQRRRQPAQRQIPVRFVPRFMLVAALLGAALTYMFDPALGRRRRALARDRARASVRRSGRALAHLRRAGGATLYGYQQKLRHLRRGDRPQPDDVTLTREVESALFRHPDLPKGRINVDVADGVVTLRGELDRLDQIRDLEALARGVPGVRDVHNLLHPAGTVAPNKAAARESAGGAVGSGSR